MSRVFALAVALLVAAAPMAASAQDHDRRGGDRERPRQEQMQQRDTRRMISQAEAQSIAQSRAGGARFVGSRGLQGGSYVFVFDDGGRIFQIAVSAYG